MVNGALFQDVLLYVKGEMGNVREEDFATTLLPPEMENRALNKDLETPKKKLIVQDPYPFSLPTTSRIVMIH